MSRNKILIAVLVAVLLLAVGFGWLMRAPERSPAGAPAAAGMNEPGSAQDVSAQQSVQSQQKMAAQAAAQQLGQKPVSGPVSARPDFVSELEWQVLQGVADQAVARGLDREKEMTRLVNDLRFNKLLEQWGASTVTATRHALAWQLLDELPAHVRGGELDHASARKLQQQLLADVLSDPEERAARAEQEAARLPGVL